MLHKNNNVCSKMDTQHTKLCNKCKQVNDSKFKTCEACRKRTNVYVKRSRNKISYLDKDELEHIASRNVPDVIPIILSCYPRIKSGTIELCGTYGGRTLKCELTFYPADADAESRSGGTSSEDDPGSKQGVGKTEPGDPVHDEGDAGDKERLRVKDGGDSKGDS